MPRAKTPEPDDAFQDAPPSAASLVGVSGRADVAVPDLTVGFAPVLKPTLSRALAVSLVFALVLHAPTLPFGGLFRGWFDPTEESDDDDEAVVPLDLDLKDIEVERAPDQEKQPPPTPQPEPKPEEKPPEAKPAEPEPKPEEKPETPEPGTPALPPEPGAGDGPPIANYKIIQELAGREANNVQVIFASTELRKHPVGLKLGTLLASHPQWEDFFAKNDLDPVKDLDGVMLTGPQFRVSNKVIAVIKAQDTDKITSVVEHLIKLGDGKWLTPKDTAKPVKAGLTKAEGFERVFAVVPDDKLLFMIPTPYPSDKRQAVLKKNPEKLKKTLEAADAKLDKHLKGVAASNVKDFSKSEYAIDAYMVEPYKLIGKRGSEGRVELPLLGEIELIPRTLTRARLRLRVEPGGGATLFLYATSKTPDQALKDAELLNSLIPAARAGASMEFKLELPEFTFEVKERSLVATVKVDDKFLEQVLAIAAEAVEKDRKLYAARQDKSRAAKEDTPNNDEAKDDAPKPDDLPKPTDTPKPSTTSSAPEPPKQPAPAPAP